jgi:hypothetical protein
MESTAATFNKNIGKMRDIKRWGVWIMMREKIDRFRATLPLIQDLRNPAMRDRHWDMVRPVWGWGGGEVGRWIWVTDVVAGLRGAVSARRLCGGGGSLPPLQMRTHTRVGRPHACTGCLSAHCVDAVCGMCAPRHPSRPPPPASSARRSTSPATPTPRTLRWR